MVCIPATFPIMLNTNLVIPEDDYVKKNKNVSDSFEYVPKNNNASQTNIGTIVQISTKMNRMKFTLSEKSTFSHLYQIQYRWRVSIWSFFVRIAWRMRWSQHNKREFR